MKESDDGMISLYGDQQSCLTKQHRHTSSLCKTRVPFYAWVLFINLTLMKLTICQLRVAPTWYKRDQHLRRWFMNKLYVILIRTLWNKIGNHGRTFAGLTSLTRHCKIFPMSAVFIEQSIDKIGHFSLLRHCLRPSKWCVRQSGRRDSNLLLS